MLYTISNEQINDMINRYCEKGGVVYTIVGALNDNYILTGPGLKTTVIKENYLNEWSSNNVIRRYNKCPKKYKKVMELLDDDYFDEAEKLFFS